MGLSKDKPYCSLIAYATLIIEHIIPSIPSGNEFNGLPLELAITIAPNPQTAANIAINLDALIVDTSSIIIAH